MVKLPARHFGEFFVAVYPVTQYQPFHPIHLDSQNQRPGQIIGRYGERQVHTQTASGWGMKGDR